MARDSHLCQYCGIKADSIDHVVPRSRGGTHTWDNVVAACRPCNIRKRDRLLHETTMHLRARPRAPLGASWSIIASGSVPGEWRPYLDGRPFDEATAIAG
jgi:5-methylcytosine-specific restriction endonuclease McrA